MVDSTYQCLDCDTSNLEQSRLPRPNLTIRHGRCPSHDFFQTELPTDLVAESMCCENGVYAGGRFEQAVDVVVRGVAFGGGLQARVQVERRKELERSATDKGESAVVTFSCIEIGFVCHRSKRQLCIGTEQI